MEEQLVPAQEFCSHHHVELNFIYSLRDYGLIDVISNEGNDYLSADKLNEPEKIIRLHYDLEVNVEGIDVILNLLKQLDDAEHRLNELNNRLKFYSL
ncbi:MAG: chaperone modulator CbpM [Flavisolibacter sp.]